MDRISAFLAAVPTSVQLLFAGVGVLYVSSIVISYTQLLLDAFVLSGTDVCICS
jgi:hypothetical protein